MTEEKETTKIFDETSVGQPRRFKMGFFNRGRPKGAKNRKTIVKEIASQRFRAVENGKPRRRTALELILLRLKQKAIEDKNGHAFDELCRLYETYQPQVEAAGAGYAVFPAEMSKEEWDAKMEERNKTRERPSDYEG